MSRFAVVNLLELDNSLGDRAPGIEGRFGRKHLDSRDLGISHFRYRANVRSPAAQTPMRWRSAVWTRHATPADASIIA